MAQKLKRTHRQLLTGRGLKKTHIKNYNISPSKTRQDVETDLISSLDYTDLYKVSIWKEKKEEKSGFFRLLYLFSCF